MPYIYNDGVSIHYQTYGKKTQTACIVLLTGAGCDHTLWRSQIDALENDFFIIAVDNRGGGKSDCPDGPYAATVMARDVLAVIAAEQRKTVNLVGFSLGGLIAQKLVSFHPEKIERLALFNCSLGPGNPDTVLPEREVVNMFLYLAALTDEDRARNSADYNFGKDYRTSNPKEYDAFFDYVIKNSAGIPAQLPVVASEEAFIADFDTVNMPVLVVMSTDDPVTPPENGDAFKKHLPHARIEYLDGYHASMLIHPTRVSTLLKEFLSKI